MTTGVVLLHFGEPSSPSYDDVVKYLTRIFLANASIESRADQSPEGRAKELAERRAPGLMSEYEEIGGSPLHSQAQERAVKLVEELGARGYEADTYIGMQYTEPSIGNAVSEALNDGVDALVGLPLYPLCGPSTTIAALDELATEITTQDPSVPYREITGWHRHQTYNRIRADGVRKYVRENAIDLSDDDTELVFSAHGTPLHYVESGSRYVEYVEEYCEVQAGVLGVDSYSLGYQNHANRGVEWTTPSIESVVEATTAKKMVIEPVSFVHEQSETLSELDIDLRNEAEARGIDFHRVPVPHDDERFPELFADLLEPYLSGVSPEIVDFQSCRCRDAGNAMCLNVSNVETIREVQDRRLLDHVE